jgi:hypothetical protein
VIAPLNGGNSDKCLALPDTSTQTCQDRNLYGQRLEAFMPCLCVQRPLVCIPLLKTPAKLGLFGEHPRNREQWKVRGGPAWTRTRNQTVMSGRL